MKKQFIPFIILAFLIVTPSKAFTATPQILGKMNIINNNIIVDLRIDSISELQALINSGIEKEIIFSVELMRNWKYWPDEFVVSKKITKVIKYDNLREQYHASSYDGLTRTQLFFNDYISVKDWIYTVNDVNLANVKELDPGNYYIRIIIESKSLEPLPLLGMLVNFIPEVEMSLAKESQSFHIGAAE